MTCLVYASLTGNTERFIQKIADLKTNWQFIKLTPNLKLESEFHLLTFTTGIGQVPALVAEFLEENHGKMLSVTACGNMNWGENFGKAGETIAQQYGVPLLMKYELAGDQQTAEQLIKIIEEKYGS